MEHNNSSATPQTRTYDKFEYHLEDVGCDACLNTLGRRKGNGCGRPSCEYQDIKDEAIRHDRIKRPRGWGKRWGEA
jgi:hypothetical protein